MCPENSFVMGIYNQQQRRGHLCVFKYVLVLLCFF